jgi:hypothetical protein
MRDPVLVGNGQGFWGDSMLGPVRLVNEGPLHYLTLDYLAEVTMSIMQKARSRDPKAGYATDFPKVVERVLPVCMDKGIRIIANAGGVNPQACAEAVAAAVQKLGLKGVRIGIVEGDDIMDGLADLVDGGESLNNMDTGEGLKPYLDKVQSANVYLGAVPIVEALDHGAHIVITGRATDPSLTVAPLMYEFGWSASDYDKLAAATVAGHIIECGTQCTGGNFTNWRSVPDMAHIGYPVVEGHPDGTFVVTKHEGTGGLVSTDTVTAQLLYELGDPRRYLTPDVTADFTTIELTQEWDNRVRVSNIVGSPPTGTYKVSIAMGDGWKAGGQLTVPGPEAVDKALFAAEILFARLEMDNVSFPLSQRTVEVVGAGVCFEGMGSFPEPAEVVLRVGVRGEDKRKVDRFGMELASLLTSGPPGLTGFAGGRPKASEIVAFWPALLNKNKVSSKTTVTEVSA